MPVDTIAERRGMLADFGFLVGYTDSAGLGVEVSIQAIWDEEHTPVLEGMLQDGISTVDLMLKVLAEDVPDLIEGDLFDLTEVPNTGTNAFVVVDFAPLSVDGAFVRVVLHRVGVTIVGEPPGNVTPPP